MQFTKLNLSNKELDALLEQKFFLLKNEATKKIIDLFGQAEIELKKKVSAYNLDITNLNISSGKIFRGENYKLFPYIILDYPRQFSVDSIFAFRTMFWWGHEFSFTLHLQGEALEKYREKLLAKLSSLYGKEIFFCKNTSPWNYHFEDDNYILLDTLKDVSEIQNKEFIKLSRKLNIKDYEQLISFCLETFTLFFDAIK